MIKSMNWLSTGLEYNHKTDRKVHSQICQYTGSSNLQQRIGGVDENNGFQSERFKMKENTVTMQHTLHRFHSSEKGDEFRIAEILPFVIGGKGYPDGSQSFQGTWLIETCETDRRSTTAYCFASVMLDCNY